VNTVLASTNTVIDGGRITTGYINANRIDATTISASNMLVNQTVRSSDFTTVGGAGFRLKSNAAGTYDDPTIYGAYIRGAKLSGSYASPDSMKIIANGYEYNYGRVYYRDFNIYDGDSIVESNLFYSHSYSSLHVDTAIPSTYSTIRYRARSNSSNNFVGSVKNLSILLFNI
jgi:hypothetical protein